MYSVSEIYANKILADNRAFSVKLTFGSSRVLSGTTIQNISLDEIVNSTDVLTMGCACSHKITINLINAPTDIDYENTYFTATVGLKVADKPITYEEIPLGKFYASDAETSNDFKNLTITAYDGFSKMTDKYNATVEENTTLQAVYDDLKTQLYENCGIVLKERVLPDYSIEHFPYLDVTYTQAVGYVAGCLGEFARFDRAGELELASYTDSGITIGRDVQYMNGFKRITEKPLVITSVSTGTQNNVIVRGNGANGTTVMFENPYITDTMADSVYANINNLVYTPCQVRWRGNPAIQAGDIVRVLDKEGESHNVLVMSQNIKIGGGLNVTIECKGKSDTTSKFSNSYETNGQKIERLYKALEQRILDATNAITGNKGGYVVLNDTNNDGKPDEILIMDMEEIPLATKVWRWNKEGLGYSHNPIGNAYAGPYRTAITADGQINAGFITTGTLSAERIAVETYDDATGLLTDYIHFDKGTMVFGEGDSALKLKLENDQIAFYRNDTRIGLFSPNSFEIENLTNGKVRFQNFGFLPRASGNLTFTKLI
jgi:hypothetical protein